MRLLAFAEEGIQTGHARPAEEVLKYGIGSIENTFDPNSPEKSSIICNTLQSYLVKQTRLRIPALVGSECLHGHAGYNSTIFPTPIALACSWNPDLVEKAFDIAGREARARGAHEAHTPVVDLGRDPRWGRIEETYGEDTHLVSLMGMAAVAGLQGGWSGEPGTTHVISAVKHFAGYGQVDGGRNFAPTHFPTKMLYDDILPPFRNAVQKARAQGIMASHCDIDGIPAHGNEWLLTRLLRDEWGFKGIVVSDYNDIKRLEEFHHVTETPAEAAELAIKAGVDLDLPVGAVYSLLDSLVKGRPDLMRYIDRSVERILTLKFKLGLFENPFVDPQRAKAFVGCDANRATARKVAEECVVLLKNDKHLLPLQSDRIRSIALIGPNAGSYSNGVYTMKTDYGISILDGIRNFAADKIKVYYHPGCIIAREFRTKEGEKIVEELPLDREEQSVSEAVRLAAKADVAVICVGGDVFTSVEATYGKGQKGDRSDLDLLGNQQELILRTIETGTPVVVVLIGGKPYAIPAIAEKAETILSTFYLGQSNGQVVADVLFGNVNPSGKLSISFPRSVGQLPIYYSQKNTGFFKDYITEKTEPLFAFGHGLSYTRFQISDLKIHNPQLKGADTLLFQCKVKNIGSREGAEVVQVYFRDLVASVTRPEKKLVRFEKVFLKPGESKLVHFKISPKQDLSFTGIDLKPTLETGTFDLLIGNASDNIILKSKFSLIK